jgi:hypothetical protein
VNFKGEEGKGKKKHWQQKSTEKQPSCVASWRRGHYKEFNDTTKRSFIAHASLK